MEVAQDWTPLDSEEAAFSSASQHKGSNRNYQGECQLRDSYYNERGRNDRNIDTRSHLYLNKASDGPSQFTSHPSTPTTRSDDGLRPSTTASVLTYQQRTTLTESQGIRSNQIGASLNPRSAYGWYSSMSNRGSYPLGGNAQHSYGSSGGGGFGPPASGGGYGPPSGGSGHGPPSGSGQGPPAGGGHGPPSGGGGGRPPPGGPGGFGGPPGGPGGFGGPLGGNQWNTSNPRRYIPGYNPTSSGINVNQHLMHICSRIT